MNRIWRTMLGGALGCAMLAAAPARAEQDTTSAPPAATKPDDAMLPAFGAVLDEQALAAHRGGQQDAFFNDMRSRASISQTSTTNVMTGSNAISDGAFTNANGVPMVIQNTGNNVVIQNSTILNLQVR